MTKQEAQKAYDEAKKTYADLLDKQRELNARFAEAERYANSNRGDSSDGHIGLNMIAKRIQETNNSTKQQFQAVITAKKVLDSIKD